MNNQLSGDEFQNLNDFILIIVGHSRKKINLPRQDLIVFHC